MNLLQKASREVTTYQQLTDVLQIILHIGNQLNQNSFRGNCRGFRLEVLAKLGDVRSNDRESLLHHVSKVAERVLPKLNNLQSGLAYSEKAYKLSLELLEEEYRELVCGMQKLKDRWHIFESASSSKDFFTAKIKVSSAVS